MNVKVADARIYDPAVTKLLTFPDNTPRFADGSDTPRAYQRMRAGCGES